jgi:hypothetical protein
MSDVFQGGEFDDEQLSTEPVRTGDSSIDAVLQSVEALGETPVDEHVAVFEQAHEQLRRALDAPSGD